MNEERFNYVVSHTRVIRPPKQSLATFGTTTIRYHLVSVPVYTELNTAPAHDEAVVREGTVRAERPQVVTPFYLSRVEGFSEDADGYLNEIMREYGADTPGLLYAYKNEPGDMSIVSGAVDEVSARIGDRLDKEDRRLEAVIQGVDDLWDISLLKFIFDLTNSSVRSNASDLHSRGLLESRGGVPMDARQRIEAMLERARHGDIDPSEVHRELERWDVFDEYQDRFLQLFRKR